MDEDKRYYVVFRVYSSKERPDLKDRSHVYGWTSSKKVLKAFLEQRDSKKYVVRKVPVDQLSNMLKRYDDETGELMIDVLKLTSTQTGEEFHIFMTEHEKDAVEKRIKRIFDELCSIDRIDGDIEQYVDMVANLEDKYYDALFYLGYRPKEVEAKFDSHICEGNFTYEGMPCEEYYREENLGESLRLSSSTDDVSTKIIFSLESFVKGMRDDL